MMAIAGGIVLAVLGLLVLCALIQWVDEVLLR